MVAKYHSFFSVFPQNGINATKWGLLKTVFTATRLWTEILARLFHTSSVVYLRHPMAFVAAPGSAGELRHTDIFRPAGIPAQRNLVSVKRMNKTDIRLEDIQRILFGQAPPLFLLEVFVRAVIVYGMLLTVVALLGKRMNGKLTIMEMAVMVTLGAIVAVPMQTPDRGILQGLLLLLCAVSFQRGISYLGFRNHRFEDILQGQPATLVREGILDLQQLQRERVSRQQLFSILRGKKIVNLGKVDRVYLEACGRFSIYTAAQSRPGLPTYPENDPEMLKSHDTAGASAGQLKACTGCGNVVAAATRQPCPVCRSTRFTQAIT